MKAFSVYVHVPYCARKCPYCDFNVHVVRAVPEQRYRDALLREIDAYAADPTWREREVASVFFGGGTPSLFGVETYEALVARLTQRFGIAPGAEIAWEANPEDLVTPDMDLAALQRTGITRVSIGAQSFDAGLLRTLGRMHRPDDIETAVEAARTAGFEDIGIDLIFAVPGQSLERWQGDLERAVGLGVTHVSTYGLTYEEGTSLTKRLAAGRVAAIDEELERAMYEAAIGVLTSHGFRHYEISNFARPGYESRHNLSYWAWRDYLGLGAGAHGFTRCDARDPLLARSRERHGVAVGGGDGALVGRTDAWGFRYENVRTPEQYMQHSPDAVSTSELLDHRMAMAEFILLGLRRVVGFSEEEFLSTFGVALSDVAPALAPLLEAGLLARDAGNVSLTRTGLLLADSVTARLADVWQGAQESV